MTVDNQLRVLIVMVKTAVPRNQDRVVYKNLLQLDWIGFKDNNSYFNNKRKLQRDREVPQRSHRDKVATNNNNKD